MLKHIWQVIEVQPKPSIRSRKMSRTNRAHEFRNLAAKNAVMSGAGKHGPSGYKRGNRDAVIEALDTMIRDDNEEFDMGLEEAARLRRDEIYMMDADLSPGNIDDLDSIPRESNDECSESELRGFEIGN